MLLTKYGKCSRNFCVTNPLWSRIPKFHFSISYQFYVQVVRMDWDGYQEEQAALAPKEHKSGEFAPTMYYQFTNGFESNGSVAFFIILPDDQAMYYLLAGHNFTTPMRIETQ